MRTIVKSRWLASAAILFACGSASGANAATNTCANLPGWSQLQSALSGVISAGGGQRPRQQRGERRLWPEYVGDDCGD